MAETERGNERGRDGGREGAEEEETAHVAQRDEHGEVAEPITENEQPRDKWRGRVALL